MPKPSFFQKLTGTDEAEEEVVIENRTKGVSEEVEDTPPPPPVAPPIEERKPAPVAKSKPERKAPTDQAGVSGNEWLPESEGQLTIDVYQTPAEIIIKSTIAGVTPEDVDISISNDMVTIKGMRKKDVTVAPEDYYYQECYWGPFSRSIILPVDIESDKADATMKNGILTIKLPKIEKIKTRKLKIKAT